MNRFDFDVIGDTPRPAAPAKVTTAKAIPAKDAAPTPPDPSPDQQPDQPGLPRSVETSADAA